MGVDRDRPGLQAARDSHRAPGVVGPDRSGEAVDRVVRDLDGLALVFERDDHGDRTEDLFARGAVRVRDGRQDRRWEPVAGALGRGPADRHLRPVIEIRGDLGALVGRDERAHLGLVVERVTDLERLDGLLKRLHEAIERGPFDEDARPRAAVLARVAEHSKGRRRGGLFEIGVGENHVHGLAAQLQRHALDGLRGKRADSLADLGRARERNLGDVGVLDEPLANDAAGAHQDVQDPFGQARLERDTPQFDRGQRRQPGRLEDDRVSGRKRRRHLPRGDGEGEVPGHDQGHDAERFAERHVHSAGDWNRLARQALGRSRVVVEDVDHHSDLTPGVADRLPDVARLELRELLEVPLHRSGDATKEVGPVLRAHRLPGGVSGFRAGDRRVRLVDRRLVKLRHHLLGRGLDHPQRSSVGRHPYPPRKCALARRK